MKDFNHLCFAEHVKPSLATSSSLTAQHLYLRMKVCYDEQMNQNIGIKEFSCSRTNNNNRRALQLFVVLWEENNDQGQQ